MLKFPEIDRVIVSFGPLAVSWYSLSYVVGILLGWYYILKLIETKTTSVSKKNVDDFISWVIIGIIIGGRLGYVLFYDPVKYLSNPIEILKTYEGGMSFHGGITGFIIASLIFCRRYKVEFLALTDLSAAATPIALGLGRVANFINAELYGRVTDVPWAFVFPYSDRLPRHPSQLYEAALEGVALFFILRYMVLKHSVLKNKGLLSGLFLLLYALFRIFVEFFREPDLKVGYLAGYFTMGQLLCLPMIFLGLFLILRSRWQCQSIQI
ncbi:MAG: prolipoprotein diacylglyceryl transferase [Rickettsiaceae bacterium]